MDITIEAGDYIKAEGEDVRKLTNYEGMDGVSLHTGETGQVDWTINVPETEILDEADLIYRYNWVCVDSRVNDKTPPAGLNGGVAYERHRALNWLICYLDLAWDDVRTDT